jgi:hypothetical protein
MQQSLLTLKLQKAIHQFLQTEIRISPSSLMYWTYQ